MIELILILIATPIVILGVVFPWMILLICVVKAFPEVKTTGPGWWKKLAEKLDKVSI